MTTYICHNCNIKIRLKNLEEGNSSAFAEKCPSCLEDSELEYL